VPHRNWKFRIQDILDSISAINEYTKEMTFSNFIKDRRTVDAVVRNLIIIGEAAVHVPENICLNYPEVPWVDIRGMRNFVVHEYFRADDKIIWNTVQIDLPPLRDILNKILEEN
jgi:uncharacterized protein with HEPN domain